MILLPLLTLFASSRALHLKLHTSRRIHGFRLHDAVNMVEESNNGKNPVQGDGTTTKEYSHDQIEWILRPLSPISSQDLEEFREAPQKLIPFLHFPVPTDGKVVLESWVHDGDEARKIGRFGITVRAGPPHPLLSESIQQLCDQDSSLAYGTAAAIIYMFVEEDSRKKGVGELALQVIEWIHANVGCSYTILVADDNGSGKLVRWYEEHGFVRAPLLQDLLGSPDAIYGVTMIAPASTTKLPEDFSIQQDEEAPIDGK